jgi:hypothetical protein
MMPRQCCYVKDLKNEVERMHVCVKQQPAREIMFPAEAALTS